jgi:hypothetical protein
MSARLSPRGGVTNGRNGRFTPTHALNASQAAFVSEYVTNGGNRQQAAKMAGYSDPRTESYRLLNTPKIRQAIQAEQERVISCEGAAKALKVMLELLELNTPANVRFQAARWLLEAARHGTAGQAGGTVDPGERQLHLMTYVELEAFVAKGLAT